jgi:hypothetical protein
VAVDGNGSIYMGEETQQQRSSLRPQAMAVQVQSAVARRPLTGVDVQAGAGPLGDKLRYCLGARFDAAPVRRQQTQ